MKKLIQFSFLFILGFLMFLFIMQATPAYADNIKITNTTDLQAKVKDAMLNRDTSLTVDYTGTYSTLKSDVSNIINNIYASDDYLHYVSKGYGWQASLIRGVIIMKFTFSYWETKLQSDLVDTKVKDVLSQIILPNMNDFDKEKVIHDWIVKNLSYDITLEHHSAYAGIVAPYKTVCQGYALLTYKMLSQAGIENKIVQGMAHSQLHVWNLVKIDSNWYQVDTTWDDPVPNIPGRVLYNYYNLTDSQIGVDHSWNKALFPSASITFDSTLNAKMISDSANLPEYQSIMNILGLQYMTDDYTSKNITDLTNSMQIATQNKQESLTIRYLNGSKIKTDLATILKKMHNISSISYSYTDYIRTALLNDIILTINFKYPSNYYSKKIK
jgi:uncharacterized protein YeeX (DUF496 family)